MTPTPRAPRTIWALALIAAGALVLAASAGPVWRLVRAAGAPVAQRPLAGAELGSSAEPRGPLRVVLIDGLARDDAGRLRSLVGVCARGVWLTVDVGFPTKSLPAQYALWTGRTPAQAGLGYDNDPMPTPPHAIPAQVPGSIAIVENTRGIAGSFGFARLLPEAAADADLPEHDPARAAAWRDRDFVAAAIDAFESDAPLVFVHILAVDDAAHAAGRDSAAYDHALVHADEILDQLSRRVRADAALLVLADHGHVQGGGHGDAERDVRFVRACIAPALPGWRPAWIHLIDLARWIADRMGATLAADARGRPLSVAMAHLDLDATLPAPTTARWLLALVVLAAIGVVTWRAGAPAWTLAWPALALAIAALIPGLPTLSHRPHLSLAWIATAAPAAVVAFVLASRRDRAGAHASPRVIALASAGPAIAIACACALLSGVPDALAGGPPARTPTWTGELLFWLAQLAAGLALAGIAILCPTFGRSRGRRLAAPAS